jgi:hypothetical protein
VSSGATYPPAVTYAPSPSYYQPWWPSADYYGGLAWWPTVLIIRDRDGFHHHHDHDGDRRDMRALQGPRGLGNTFPLRTSLPIVHSPQIVRQDVRGAQPQRMQIPTPQLRLPSIERQMEIQASPRVQSFSNEQMGSRVMQGPRAEPQQSGRGGQQHSGGRGR